MNQGKLEGVKQEMSRMNVEILGMSKNSVIFETAPKYCISDSFVDYEDYFISSKGFLPTVVDIMVI